MDYILKFFDSAREAFYGSTSLPKQDGENDGPVTANASTLQQNPLFHKQAIIVLREELEYFAIPPKRPASLTPAQTDAYPMTDADGFPNAALLDLKRKCGDTLLQRTLIFTALQRNVNRENNVAEQHLIDMLCMRSVGVSDYQ